MDLRCIVYRCTGFGFVVVNITRLSQPTAFLSGACAYAADAVSPRERDGLM